MIQRLTGGTAEWRERVTAQEPVGRMGKPERDRGGRCLVVFGGGGLRYWTRDGRRRRPNGVVMFVATPRPHRGCGNVFAQDRDRRRMIPRAVTWSMADGLGEFQLLILQKTIKKSYGRKSLLY